jgi:hypothetical protein
MMMIIIIIIIIIPIVHFKDLRLLKIYMTFNPHSSRYQIDIELTFF